MPEINQDFETENSLQEAVINIDRVSRVVKGGRRFRFKALVAVGNGKDQLGVGVSKGTDVQSAIAKATDVAKKNMTTIALNGDTIPHDTFAKVSGAKVLLKPASQGTGLIAGGTVRALLNVTGVNNVLSKSLGSSNKVNIAYATVDALKLLVPRSQWLNSPTKPKAKAPTSTKDTAKASEKGKKS